MPWRVISTHDTELEAFTALRAHRRTGPNTKAFDIIDVRHLAGGDQPRTTKPYAVVELDLEQPTTMLGVIEPLTNRDPGDETDAA